MATTEAPEMLIYRIEQCQKIATLARDPYTQMQILNTVVRILMQAQLLPLKEFDTWEQTPNKMYPGLKTFIHEAYTRRLQSLALRATTATQTAAFMTASTIGTTYGGATTILSEISTAINQLAANQLAIQQQMAAMTFTANAPAHHTQFQIPPIQNMGQQPFAGATQGSFNTGRGGGGCQHGGHGRGRTGSLGGGRGCGAFAQQIQGGFGDTPPFVYGPPMAFVPSTGACVNAPFQSYLTK
jgi:hypothetical protein